MTNTQAISIFLVLGVAIVIGEYIAITHYVPIIAGEAISAFFNALS